MRIDIVDVGGRKSGVLDGERHALRLILAVRRRTRDVVGVGVRAVADKLGVDVCAALLGVLQAFQNDETRALAHHEAAAVLVEGARGMRRIVVVISAKSLHRAKACDGGFGDARFRAAGDGDVRLADLYGTERMSDAVRPRRTGRHDARRRAVQAVGDGDLPRRHVRDHHRNEERTDLRRPFVKKLPVLAVHRLDAADAGADERADALPVLFFEIELRILDGELRRRDSELRIAIHTLRFLLVDVRGRIEILDLARNLRVAFRCVEVCDLADAVLSCKKRLPESFPADANRRDRAQTRYDYTIAQAMTPHSVFPKNYFLCLAKLPSRWPRPRRSDGGRSP